MLQAAQAYADAAGDLDRLVSVDGHRGGLPISTTSGPKGAFMTQLNCGTHELLSCQRDWGVVTLRTQNQLRRPRKHL